MLYELKKCNKFKERIIKYNEQIKEIEKNIDILKNYMKPKESELNISIENNIIDNKIKPKFNRVKNELTISHNIEIFGRFNNKIYEEDNKSEGGSEDRKQKRNKREKRKNKIIKEFIKVEDLFDISDVDIDKENIIDDDLNSDDEIVFNNKIRQPIKLTEYHIDDIKKEIPEINLAQIEYNKMKVIREDDLYSLQRRKIKNQNLDNKIKDLKKDIEKMEEKLDLIKSKEKIMKDYIEKVKKNYLEIRKFNRRNTSVHNKKTKLIKKSLLYNGENIKEEDISEEEDDDDNNYGSDYENEQNEEEDFGKGKQSVYVGDEDYIKNNVKSIGGWRGKLGKSVRDDMFKNKLRNKLKKIRAKSK
jgi:hypothetical protein